MQSRFYSPSIVLVAPQMAENIGAAARAMLNFGLTDLRLVAPRDGWPHESAEATAAGAFAYVTVQCFDTVADALADCHYVYATTARRRNMTKPVFTPRDAMSDCCSRARAAQHTAIVFGAERTGLENNDLALCQAIVTIPTNPDFSSLNLGQGVLLLAYEWMQSAVDARVDEPEHDIAPIGALNIFLQRLESDLDERRFFRTLDMKPTVWNNIRNIFTRAEVTSQEVKTLQGVLSALRGNKTRDE